MTTEATRAPTGTSKAFTVGWRLVAGEAGAAVDFAQYTDKSVQVTGTFGAAGAAALQGSNDGTNYAVLSDPQGNALSFTTAGIRAVTEATRYVRPAVTGDGTTDLTITLLMKE